MFSGNLDGGWAFSSISLKTNLFFGTSTISNTLVAFGIFTTLKESKIHPSTSSCCSMSKIKVLINTSSSLTKVS